VAKVLTAMIADELAKKFLRWGAQGSALPVREAIPILRSAGQARSWMNCAALATSLLERPYWVGTPHALC